MESWQNDFSDSSVVTLISSTPVDDSDETTPLNRTTGSVQVRQNDSVSGTSWYASIFLVVNAALGAGLLNFPVSYHHCGGIVIAIIVQTILAVFVVGSMMILIHCAQVHNSATYQDVVFASCGRVVRILCSIVIALYTFGTCITFFIIIGDQWDKFLSLVYGETYCNVWYMNRKFTISLSAIVVVLPLCFPRRIDFLKYASVVGSVAVLYCVALVTIKYFTDTARSDNCPIAYGPETWMDIFTVIPVICFGYQCHLSLVPIYACTRERTLSVFSRTIIIAMGLCFISYTVTASFGYLTFGSCVQADILLSYDPTPDVLVAVIFIAIKMYTTYPLLCFVGRAAIDSVWVDAHKSPVVMTPAAERQHRIILTLIWFIASLLIALFIPNITVVIELLGGLAAIFIFIFPGLCLLQLLLDGYLGTSLCWLRYATYVVISGSCLVLGMFILGLTTTQSLMKDFSEDRQHIEPVVHNSSNHQCP